MGRISNSWQTTKQSWGVLKQDKELILFPVISGLASLLIMASFIYPTWTSGLLDRAVDEEDPQAQQTMALIYLGMYFILSFITIYFNAALIHAARERLQGGDPNVWTGLRGANKKLGKIFLWSLFAASVSLLIHALEAAARRANNFFAHIMTQILGMAWTLLIFFAIPVVLFEDKGVFASLKRSGQLFKQRWGESLVGQYGIGLVFGLMGLAVILFFGMLVGSFGMATVGTTPEGQAIQEMTSVGWAIAAIGLAAFLLVTVTGLALGGVYKAALYHFATTGSTPPGYNPGLVENAYRAEQARPMGRI